MIEKNIVDFNNIPEQPEKEKIVINKRVQKGAQELTIVSIEDTMSKGGTPGFVVTFANNEGTTFPHTFWNTPKAIIRMQNLVVGFIGEKPEGSMDTQALSALLVGQTSNCVVDADVKLNESNGKVYRNLYPTLRYTGFANKTTPFKDEDARENEPVNTPAQTSVLDKVEEPDSDLPF